MRNGIRRHSGRTRYDTGLAQAAWAGLGTLIAVGINQPIVHLVHEARPYTTLHNILVLATHSADPGFPSDHATMAGAVAVGLLLVSRKLGWVIARLPLITAMHWLRALPGIDHVFAPIADAPTPRPRRHTQLFDLALRFEGEHARMGVDEDAELITAILLVIGLLPFVLAWLEQSLEEPKTPRRPRRHRRL